MNRVTHALEVIFNFFASIKLAIIVLLSFAVICAVGTIYEARYDAGYAQKMIYQSPAMYFVMGLLCINLINVIISRWPWKPHHSGFIFAHIGIILLIAGSLITRIYGVDGSIMFDIGQKNRYVSLSDTDLVVYTSYGDGSYKMLHSEGVDFLKRPPEKYPYTISIGSQKLRVINFYPWAARDQKTVPSASPISGPAIRLQLQNERVNITQWLNRPASSEKEEIDLGPAKIILAASDTKYTYRGGNEIVFRPTSEDKDKNKSIQRLRYEIYTKSRGGLTGQGFIAESDSISTGWMGIQLRLLKYIPHAEQKIEYTKRERPNGNLTSAVLIDFSGQQVWVGLNSNVRILDDDTMYVVSYRNRLLDLGFDMVLEQFQVGRYQGTNRAKSYESVVYVDGLGSQQISMNNPLKHGGYTFYQASFQEDAKGVATTSILSVNRDPGRFLKYFGSFIIVLGMIVMFYFKRYQLWGAK